jgi:hypothetical protein
MASDRYRFVEVPIDLRVILEAIERQQVQKQQHHGFVEFFWNEVPDATKRPIAGD